MKRRLLCTVLYALAAILLVALPVLAVTSYYAPLTIVSTSVTSYTNLPVICAVNNTYLAANNFITATGQDTRVQTTAGSVLPHMVADDKTLVVVDVPAAGNVNLQYTTGNTVLLPFYTILGYNGTLAVADDADLELNNSFTIDIKGYLDASGAGVKNIYTGSNYALTKSAANTIQSAITFTTHTVTLQPSGAGSETNIAILVDPGPPPAPVNWHANLPPDDDATSYVSETVPGNNTDLYAMQDFNGGDVPITNVRVTIRALATGVNAGVRTRLKTGAVISEGVFTTPLAWAAVFTDYALNPEDGLAWAWVDIISLEAGVRCNAFSGDTAYNSTVTVTVTYGDITNTITSASMSGVRRITDTLAAGAWTLTADTTPVQTNTVQIGSLTVPNNAGAYALIAGNVMPAMEYLKVTTAIAPAGEKLWFQPAAIIAGQVLPDRQATGGAEDGTITWGAMPASVTATLGSLVSLYQPGPSGALTSPSPSDTLPEVEVRDWHTAPDVAGPLMTNPLRPFVLLVSDHSTLTETQVWYFYGLIFVLLVTMVTAGAVRQHYLITGIAMAGAMIALVVMTVWPMWALVFAAMAVVGGLVAERSPVL